MHLKKCVVIAAELITEVAQILEDKKVNFGEIIGIAPELMKIPAFVGSLPFAIDELKAGISDAYKIEIEKAIADNLDLPNDKAEKITELTIGWVLFTSETALQIKKVVKG